MSVEVVAQRYPGLDIKEIMSYLKPPQIWHTTDVSYRSCDRQARVARVLRTQECYCGANRRQGDRRHTEPHYKLDPQQPLDETASIVNVAATRLRKTAQRCEPTPEVTWRGKQMF